MYITPSNWFLAPPSYERQQTFVRHATRELRRFVELYPAHRLVGQARKLLDDAERQLYEHELFVARFYRSRDKPAGVVQRMEHAMRQFPELAGTEDNYLTLAKAYVQTKRVGNAEALYQAYLDRFPSGQYTEQAKKSLQALRSLRETPLGKKEGDK